jgi:hypothetical protein
MTVAKVFKINDKNKIKNTPGYNRFVLQKEFSWRKFKTFILPEKNRLKLKENCFIQFNFRFLY